MLAPFYHFENGSMIKETFARAFQKEHFNCFGCSAMQFNEFMQIHIERTEWVGKNGSEWSVLILEQS